jgi:hypothetical protein
MAITTTFNILSMNVVPTMDNLSQVVISVVSQVVSTNGMYAAQQTFTDVVSPPNPQDFIPYQNLTQAEVMKWIPDHGADPVVLAYLANNINEQQNPPVVTPPLPWSNS